MLDYIDRILGGGSAYAACTSRGYNPGRILTTLQVTRARTLLLTGTLPLAVLPSLFGGEGACTLPVPPRGLLINKRSIITISQDLDVAIHVATCDLLLRQQRLLLVGLWPTRWGEGALTLPAPAEAVVMGLWTTYWGKGALTLPAPAEAVVARRL